MTSLPCPTDRSQFFLVCLIPGPSFRPLVAAARRACRWQLLRDGVLIHPGVDAFQVGRLLVLGLELQVSSRHGPGRRKNFCAVALSDPLRLRVTVVAEWTGIMMKLLLKLGVSLSLSASDSEVICIKAGHGGHSQCSALSLESEHPTVT